MPADGRGAPFWSGEIMSGMTAVMAVQLHECPKIHRIARFKECVLCCVNYISIRKDPTMSIPGPGHSFSLLSRNPSVRTFYESPSPASGHLCASSRGCCSDQCCRERSLDISLCDGFLEAHAKRGGYIRIVHLAPPTPLRNSFAGLGRGGRESHSVSTPGPCKPPEISENRAMKMENK